MSRVHASETIGCAHPAGMLVSFRTFTYSVDSVIGFSGVDHPGCGSGTQ
jgi:hypothetical protein